MATQTRPFMITGAALAGAVAIIAASPAIAPSISLPSPTALSAAKVELTTFSDIFTIPSSQWIAGYFQGYGGLIGGTTDPVTQAVTPNPYAPNCFNNCYASGVPGILYLASDALVNGNGNGWDDAAAWPTSAVNYYFEGWQTQGLTPLYHYLAATATGNSPVVQTLLDLFFAQPSSFAQIFSAAVTTTAALVSKVPLVGPYVAGAMYAYLGYNGYTQGLPGVLNFVIDLVTGNITPPAASSSAAATALAAPAAALQSTVNRAINPAKAAAPAVSVAAPTAAEVAAVKPVTAVRDAVVAAKADKTEATESATGSDATTGTKPVDSSTESESADSSTETESADSSTETKSTETKSTETEATETKPEVKPADTTPGATKPADAVSGVAAAAKASTPAATKSAESAAKTRKHPVRDAVQKATKQIASALGGAKAGASK